MLDAHKGLIQYVADNFDTQICSQNGLKQTHGLAAIVTQPISVETHTLNIARIPKTKISSLETITDTDRKSFTGVKNPQMSPEYAVGQMLPQDFLYKIDNSLISSQFLIFNFLKDSLTREQTPDYSGYCTAKARVDGSPLLPQTKLLFQPYVDKSPTDPSTILSAMEDAERICNSAGQKYTVFTVDQQLNAIALNI